MKPSADAAPAGGWTSCLCPSSAVGAGSAWGFAATVAEWRLGHLLVPWLGVGGRGWGLLIAPPFPVFWPG